jgi:hypothetical protein
LANCARCPRHPVSLELGRGCWRVLLVGGFGAVARVIQCPRRSASSGADFPRSCLSTVGVDARGRGCDWSLRAPVLPLEHPIFTRSRVPPQGSKLADVPPCRLSTGPATAGRGKRVGRALMVRNPLEFGRSTSAGRPRIFQLETPGAGLRAPVDTEGSPSCRTPPAGRRRARGEGFVRSNRCPRHPVALARVARVGTGCVRARGGVADWSASRAARGCNWLQRFGELFDHGFANRCPRHRVARVARVAAGGKDASGRETFHGHGFPWSVRGEVSTVRARGWVRLVAACSANCSTRVRTVRPVFELCAGNRVSSVWRVRHGTP